MLRAALGRQPRVELYGTDYDTPDGSAVRDYIHVEDLAHAHALALDRDRAGRHQIFNLGNGNGFSVREVIDACQTVTGRERRRGRAPAPARRPAAPRRLAAAAREQLGWEPRKPELETMIADAWAWHQAHPDGYPG